MAAISWYGRALWSQDVAAETVVLKTPSGVLRGQAVEGVRIFKGVPFAQPPVGPLRFKPSVQFAPWSGERNATQFAAAAMQHGGPPHKSEDCLYLNVWTPAGARDEGLPVLVWVHGGGFTGGESFAPVFDGAEFAKAGIVVVTVAYRLGVLGFLDVGPLLGHDYAGSANNGVSDVYSALLWVKQNIGAFGGDSKRVTLGGQSAGAKMTGILAGVPAAEGLFSAMISESGGAERVWPLENAETVARGFEKIWAQPAETLKTADAAALIAVQQSFVDSWPQHFPLRCEVDGKWLPRLPIKSIATGSTKGKRLLIGTNLDESAAFLGPHPSHDPTAADLGNLPLGRFDAVFAQYAKIYPEMSAEQLRIRAVSAEEYWIPSGRRNGLDVSAGLCASQRTDERVCGALGRVGSGLGSDGNSDCQ
jgi:para-nitrobenzyl esterase